MNYLAHAWLSFNRPEILVGNMISDFVKGKKRFEFSKGIQQGIMLHRNIDMFTDAHAATKAAKEFFKPSVGLYAGAFIDVVYDHFLARDANEFSGESLLRFTQQVYSAFDTSTAKLPEKFASMYYYMKRDNWLYNYYTLYGIEQSFAGLAHRAKYLDNSKTAFICFKANYEHLHNCYTAFFPDIKKFVYGQLNPSHNNL